MQHRTGALRTAKPSLGFFICFCRTKGERTSLLAASEVQLGGDADDLQRRLLQVRDLLPLSLHFFFFFSSSLSIYLSIYYLFLSIDFFFGFLPAAGIIVLKLGEGFGSSGFSGFARDSKLRRQDGFWKQLSVFMGKGSEGRWFRWAWIKGLDFGLERGTVEGYEF